MRNLKLSGSGSQRTNSGMWIFLLIVLFLMIAISANAAGPLYKTTRASQITNKLLRGVINIPFCFMEIPRSINQNVQNTDIFTGTFVGLGEGVFKSSKRLCYGVFETATFPSPELKTLNPWVDYPIPFKELSE